MHVKTHLTVHAVTMAYLLRYEAEIAIEGKLSSVIRNLLMNTHKSHLLFA